MSNIQNIASALERVVSDIESLIETLGRETHEDTQTRTAHQSRHASRWDDYSPNPFDDPPSGLVRQLEVQRACLRLQRIIEDLEGEITALEKCNDTLRIMLGRLRSVETALD